MRQVNLFVVHGQSLCFSVKIGVLCHENIVVDLLEECTGCFHDQSLGFTLNL